MSAKMAVSSSTTLADRMDAADLGRRLAHRQGDVDRLGIEPLNERGALQGVLARCKRCVHRLFEAV